MDRRPPITSSTAAPATNDAGVRDAVRHGDLIQQSRRRWASPDVRDRWSLRTGALAFALAAAALAATADWSSVRVGVIVLAVPALAAASLVELEVGSASAVPTEPVVIAMLLLLPPGVVPLATFAALAASSAWLAFRGGRRESPAIAACSSMFVVGPVLVVQVLGLGPAGPRWWAVVAVAFAAQVASDLAVSWWRNCVGLGLGFGELVGMLRVSYSIDLLLVPGAVAAVMAVHGSPAAILLALCPAALIALLARDRATQIDRLISLGTAYADAADQARLDSLTDLGNRLAWDEALAEADVSGGGGRGAVGVLMLDVDHLKLVNDRSGHEAGDLLLATVAEVLREVASPWGLTCRLGGDEFGVLVRGAAAADLGRLAAHLKGELGRRPPIDAVPVSASIGFAANVPGHTADAVRDADRAMYRDKRLRTAPPGLTGAVDLARSQPGAPPLERAR